MGDAAPSKLLLSRPLVMVALSGLLALVLLVAVPPREAFALAGGGLLTTTRSLGLSNAPVELSAAQRAAQLATNTGGAVRAGGAVTAVTGGTTLAAAGAGTVGAVAIVGLGIGWEVGSGVAGIFGLDSKGALADLAGVGPDPAAAVPFVPNRDLSAPSAGWQGASGFRIYDRDNPATFYPVQGGSLQTVDRNYIYAGPPVYGGVFDDIIAIEVGIGMRPQRPGGGYFPVGGNVLAYGVDGQTVARCQLDSSTADSINLVNCGMNTGSGGLDRLEFEYAPNSFVKWYPSGHPGEAGADPERRWETETRCSDGSVLRTLSVGFRETDSTFPPFAQPVACPSGASVTGVSVDKTTPDGTAPRERIATQDQSTAVSDWATANPNCLAGGCVMELSRIDASTGARTGCEGAGTLCRDWASDPDRAKNYECRYAGQVIALEECAPYAERYQDPAIARPIVGDPLPTPGTGTTPGTGGSTTPGAGGQPAADDPAGQECFPRGWGVLNPVEWVLKPVGCALRAAFIPSTASQARIGQVRTLAATRAPFPEIRSSMAVFASPDLSARCLDFALRGMPEPLPANVPIINTCDGSNPVVAALLRVRTLVGAAVWVAFLAPLAWWAWKQYAPGSQGVA